jgi:threonine dehydrogenase-like Zn-dependent dehydrogenase
MLYNQKIIINSPKSVSLKTEIINHQLQNDDILIECKHSLISPGTELSMYNGTHIGILDPLNTYTKYPFYPGYSAVGLVKDIGRDVKDFDINQWIYYSGYHEKYSIYNHMSVYPIHTSLPPYLMTFIKFINISNIPLLVSDLKIHTTVLVIGLGIIGNIVSQLLLLRGLRVIAIDNNEFRCIMAEKLGVEIVMGDVDELINTIKNNDVSLIIEASGSIKSVEMALCVSKSLGEIILLGSTQGVVTIDVYKYIHKKGLIIKGAHLNVASMISNDNPNHLTTSDIISLISNNMLNLESLITNRITPINITKEYEKLGNKNKNITSIIDW